MMLTMTATVDGKEHVFRTNKSGAYLFTGAGENRQLSNQSGFDSIRIIQKTIRYYLQREKGTETLPKIVYKYTKSDGWRI